MGVNNPGRESSSGPMVSALEFQAVGDGASDDTAALKLGIQQLADAGGGTLVCTGHHLLSDELPALDTVTISGVGAAASSLSWPEDLGPGKFAMPRQADLGDQPNAPRIKDIALKGPGEYALGQQTADMDGVQLGTGTNLTDVSIEGFRSGAFITGDHNVLTRVRAAHNYFNLHFGPNPQTVGNQWFYGCVLAGANFATVGVAGDNVVDGCLFSGGHGGFAPYVFYKYGAHQQPLLNNTMLHNFAFEATGNAAFLDESQGGDGQSLRNSQIVFPGFSWRASVKDPSRPRSYAVDVRSTVGLHIAGGATPFTPGDLATYNIAQFQQGCSIVQQTVPNDLEKMFSPGSWEEQILTFEQGRIRAVCQYTSGPLSVGDLVERSGDGTVRRYRGLGTVPPHGVSMTNNAAQTNAIVALPGSEVGVTCGQVTGSGVALVADPSTPHHAIQSDGTTRGVLIGTSCLAGSGLVRTHLLPPTAWP